MKKEKYNLKQMIKISTYDFFESADFHFVKNNSQPIRNLFRKKENKKYKTGWTRFLDENLYTEEELFEKGYVIKNGILFEKPDVWVIFNNKIIFKKRFETFEEAEKFAKKVKKLAMTDNDYVVDLNEI